MFDDRKILCGSSRYEKVFYFNHEFNGLPDQVKKELNIISVLFTEEVGGILRMEFDSEGVLHLTVESKDNDYIYDEITSGLKIRQMQDEHRELFESLETWYRIFMAGD